MIWWLTSAAIALNGPDPIVEGFVPELDGAVVPLDGALVLTGAMDPAVIRVTGPDGLEVPGHRELVAGTLFRWVPDAPFAPGPHDATGSSTP